MLWAAGIYMPASWRTSACRPTRTPAEVINMSLGGTGACTPGVPRRDDPASTPPASSSSPRPATAPAMPSARPANCPGVHRRRRPAPRRHQGRLLRPRPGDRDQRAGRQLRQPRRRRAVPVPDHDDDRTRARRRRSPAPPARSTPTASTRRRSAPASPRRSSPAPSALMLSVKPSLTPAQVRSMLQATARPFPTTGGSAGTPQPARRRPASTSSSATAPPSTCGAGMLDAHAAVAAAVGVQAQHLGDDRRRRPPASR